MRVLAYEIVNFVSRHIALLIEAFHTHRKPVARLAVIEGLDRNPARLQLPRGTPVSD